HHLLHQGRAPATILCGPVQAYPPAVVQPLVPGHAGRATRVLRKFVLILPPLHAVRVQIGLQPGPKLLAKRLFLGRIGKIHASPPYFVEHCTPTARTKRGQPARWSWSAVPSLLDVGVVPAIVTASSHQPIIVVLYVDNSCYSPLQN